MYILENDFEERMQKKRKATPIPRKRLKFEAQVLGMSDLLNASCNQVPQTPLDMFIADESSYGMPCSTSTPKSPARALPLHAAANTLNVGTDEPNVPISTVQQLLKLEVDKQLQPLSQRIEQLEQQERVSKNQLKLLQERIVQLERDVISSDAAVALQKAEVNNLKQAAARKQNDVTNVKTVPLTPLDCQKLHLYDSEFSSYHLDQQVLEDIRLHSNSKRHFISNMCRKMFSMEERIRDCNVAGIKTRAPMSPSRSRYGRIILYTSQQYQVPHNHELAKEVRNVIDDTNRKYREELKKRKNAKIVQESLIAAPPLDDA